MTERTRAVDVLVFGSMWWSGHQLTDQRVTRALADLGRHVVYVNPSYAPIASKRQTQQGHPDALGPLVLDRNLEVFSPVGLPLRSKPVIATVNAWLTAVQVMLAYLLRLRSGTRIVVFAAHPSLMALLRPWRRVVVVKDDYAASAGLIGQRSESVRRRRRRTLNRATAIITVSESLAQSLLKQGFPSTVIPPGTTIPSERPPDTDLASVPRPRAVFSGLISERIDFRVLRAIAEAGWHLVLIGGVQPTFGSHEELEQLLAYPNVSQLGWQSPDEVQAIARCCDVGLLPYTLSDFNKASSPLKTLEYLAAGIPVLATALPSVLGIDSPDVHVVDQVDAVPSVLETLQRDLGNEEHRQRRVAYAEGNTWAARAQRYLEVITS